MPDLREFFGRWTRSEVARGITRWERKDEFHARVLSDTPGLHIHYFTDDHDVEAQGWGVAHLVCHDCHRARRVVYPNFDDAEVEGDLGIPALRKERAAFVAAHQHGGLYAAGGGRVLCPPSYAVTETVDLRSGRGVAS